VAGGMSNRERHQPAPGSRKSSIFLWTKVGAVFLRVSSKCAHHSGPKVCGRVCGPALAADSRVRFGVLVGTVSRRRGSEPSLERAAKARFRVVSDALSNLRNRRVA
jgi:hypothetical protein